MHHNMYQPFNCQYVVPLLHMQLQVAEWLQLLWSTLAVSVEYHLQPMHFDAVLCMC